MSPCSQSHILSPYDFWLAWGIRVSKLSLGTPHPTWESTGWYYGFHGMSPWVWQTAPQYCELLFLQPLVDQTILDFALYSRFLIFVILSHCFMVQVAIWLDLQLRPLCEYCILYGDLCFSAMTFSIPEARSGNIPSFEEWCFHIWVIPSSATEQQRFSPFWPSSLIEEANPRPQMI